MIQRWLWRNLTYCNSPTITFAFYHVQTQQRSGNITQWKICINLIIQRQKPNNPNITTKGWSTQDLWKDTASEDGEVVTLMWTSEAPAPCRGESWVEQGEGCHCAAMVLADALNHRVNTMKHCTMPLGTAISRHGPRMEPWGGRRECTLVLLKVLRVKDVDSCGQAEGIRERKSKRSTGDTF